mgnify:FL=1|tara:strand:- start:1001 stop:1264 length:264 start_codon:yes stop_codon:yes gene_type:complete
MAIVTGAGTVGVSQGVGRKTFVFAVTTGTISMADSITSATTTYNMTVLGVSGTTGTSHLLCSGGNTDGTNGLENTSGIALVATFDQA